MSKKNRLLTESSPYLLQHKDNPVAWYPWGQEAFQLAQKEDKPIFLSIGYAACHWCHVMAYESFEDPQTAQIMNDHFINIKVDREERPDVDTIYMNAVIAITGQGGWPLSVFLTPDGKPFYGGTYFPPIRRYNMPSFREVLLYLDDQWRNHRERLLESSETLTRHVQRRVHSARDETSLHERILDQAAERLFEDYDWQHGGWGDAPKFPASSAIEALLLRYHRKNDRLALDMASHVLDHMRRGGIHDQFGGGFHRYSVDERWLVPHFEKMLYDNALLLRTYLHHWQITQDKGSYEVVNQLIEFLVREMRHEEGGFYSSLDADSEGEEGTYYLWNYDEIAAVIAPHDSEGFSLQAFGISEEGNFEGKNIPSQPLPLDKLAKKSNLDQIEVINQLMQIRKVVLKHRERRPRPATDDKIITAWNGLILISLSEAARATDQDQYLDYAQELASFLLDELYVDGILLRTWRNGRARYPAYLEDYAALALGLLSLYQVDFNPQWLKTARRLASTIIEKFSDPEGGFFDTASDHEDLIARPKSLQDTPTPSGNALATELFLKLATLEGDQPWAAPAHHALAMMQETAASYPSAFAAWLNALDFALGPQLQLAITAPLDSSDLYTMLEVSNKPFLPRLVQAVGDPSLEDQPEILATRPVADSGITAYLCQGFSCQLPTQSADTLREQIENALKGPNASS